MAEVPERLRARIEDLRRRVPSIAKAGRVVGYRPQVPLDETLRRVIEFLRASGRS
jgi:nucleoside-diphosphate-sugar epimerase